MKMLPWMIAPLRCASKMGFLSRNVWNNLIASGSATWKNDKWRALVSRGYFATSQRYNDAQNLLVLTCKGRRAAEALGLEPVSPPFSDYIPHDEMILEYALKLEAEGLISGWESEQEQRQKSYKPTQGTQKKSGVSKFPDLVMRLAVPGQPTLIAVELERTRKSSERYKEFVKKYLTLADIDSVIVLAQNRKIIDAIKRAVVVTTYPQHMRAFSYGLISEAMKSPALAPLKCDQKVINLESAVASILRNRNAVTQLEALKLRSKLRYTVRSENVTEGER